MTEPIESMAGAIELLRGKLGNASQDLEDIMDDYCGALETQIARFSQQRDELRRLLRECLPYVRYAGTTHTLSQEDQYDLDHLIDLINASAPEPQPEPRTTPDDDGDMPNDVPF